MVAFSVKFPGVLVLVAALLSCSSEAEFTAAPADVSGSYLVALTNRASSCDFKDWVEGKEAAGIGFSITQDGETLHASVDGVTGVWLGLALGSAEFEGSVTRTSLELVNYGSRAQTVGNCTFTYDATVNGELEGDAISGTISYAPHTNGASGCEAVECQAVQDFSGSRPPR
jgi:hypothetical protein